MESLARRPKGLLTKIDLRGETDEDKHRHDAFLITESQALYHHVSEALIRLFLAHSTLPPCPWIEVAALRNFGVFEQRAAELCQGLPDRVIQRCGV
jgi:hypothetical protein